MSTESSEGQQLSALDHFKTAAKGEYDDLAKITDMMAGILADIEDRIPEEERPYMEIANSKIFYKKDKIHTSDDKYKTIEFCCGGVRGNSAVIFFVTSTGTKTFTCGTISDRLICPEGHKEFTMEKAAETIAQGMFKSLPGDLRQRYAESLRRKKENNTEARPQ